MVQVQDPPRDRHRLPALPRRRRRRRRWVLASGVALAVALVVLQVGPSGSWTRGGTGQDVIGLDLPVPMSPPDGVALVQDLRRAGQWVSENDGFVTQLLETGPTGDPVLRSTLVNGQAGAAGLASSERNDLQGGTVPLDSVRWMTWSERFVEMPKTDLDRWQVIGPNEIHGETVPQAVVMPEVSPDGHRRLNANAGRTEPRYFDLGAIELGRWSSYKFGIHYTQDDDGWMELWRDGERVVRVEGPTTSEARPGYWKFGHYRNSAIDGTSIYDVSGVRVYGR